MVAISAHLKKAVEFARLHKHFNKYFEVVPAVTDKLVQEAYKVRHQVYCVELGWEPITPKGLEQDKYDNHAIHCLLRSRSQERFIGCIRLALPFDDGVNLHLPLQNACADKLFPGHPDPIAMENREVAEVSRLAIVGDFRRREDERVRAAGVAGEDTDRRKSSSSNEGGNGASERRKKSQSDRRKFPYMPVALYLGMMEQAAQQGIHTVYFMTEPLLARHFGRLGADLELVGEGVEHRGLRKPFLMDVNLVRRKVIFALKPMMNIIRKDIQRYNDLKASGRPIPIMNKEDGAEKAVLVDYRDY